jgi:hypothetical protein
VRRAELRRFDADQYVQRQSVQQACDLAIKWCRVLTARECRSMTEHFARLAEEPNRLPHESAVLLHLSQSWAVFAWATELLEQHAAASLLNLETLNGEAED